MKDHTSPTYTEADHQASEPVNVTIVNHGKAFGKTNWYTFYCEKCRGQVEGRAEYCVTCGVTLYWPGEE